MIEKAIKIIENNNATCVVIKDNKIIKTDNGRGIGSLIKMYEEGLLRDTVVVDKIIGKAAATIFALARIKKCFGFTMSKSAKSLLESNNIKCEYKTLTDYIVNRKGDGMCPMESSIINSNDLDESIKLLKNKIEELKKVL